MSSILEKWTEVDPNVRTVLELQRVSLFPTFILLMTIKEAPK